MPVESVGTLTVNAPESVSSGTSTAVTTEVSIGSMPIPGATVEARAGELVGRGTTDSDGVAVVDVSIPGSGETEVSWDARRPAPTREQVIDASDAFYAVTDDGWELVDGPWQYPDTIQPDGSTTLRSDHYDDGLDAVEWSGSAMNAVYEPAEGPEEVATSSVYRRLEPIEQNSMSRGLGWILADGVGSLGQFQGLGSDGEWVLAYAIRMESVSLGGSVTDRSVVHQRIDRRQTLSLVSGDVEGFELRGGDNYGGYHAELSTSSYKTQTVQGPLAVVEGGPVPPLIRLYFQQIYAKRSLPTTSTTVEVTSSSSPGVHVIKGVQVGSVVSRR